MNRTFRGRTIKLMQALSIIIIHLLKIKFEKEPITHFVLIFLQFKRYVLFSRYPSLHEIGFSGSFILFNQNLLETKILLFCYIERETIDITYLF